MLLPFLRPFAPRALPRFLALTDALTCAGEALANVRPLAPSVPGRVPCFMLATFRPFRPHPRPVSDQAFLLFTFSTGIYLWLRVTQSRLELRSFGRWLAQHGPPHRFVILRTGRSPSVAPHAGITPTQSLWLPGVNIFPEADFHRPDCATRRRTTASRAGSQRVESHDRADVLQPGGSAAAAIGGSVRMHPRPSYRQRLSSTRIGLN